MDIDTDDLRRAGVSRSVVPGPSAGTVKPSATSPLIMLPNGQIVGIDNEMLMGEDGSTALQPPGRAGTDARQISKPRDALCLYVDVVHRSSTGDYTVVLDLRGEDEADAPPRVGVDAGIAGGIPNTKTGAFAAALEIMVGNSPSGIFTEVVDAVERNPDVVVEANSPDEPSLEEALGDLEAQSGDGSSPGTQGSLGGGRGGSGNQRRDAAREPSQSNLSNPDEPRQRSQRDTGQQSGLGNMPSREETAKATEEAEERQRRREEQAEDERPNDQDTFDQFRRDEEAEEDQDDDQDTFDRFGN
jgi:hypothetical protein